MLQVLVLSAIPALAAASLGSAGLALLAGAGLLWAAALYACSVAPVVAGSLGRSVNEAVATTCSVLAGAVAILGIVVLFVTL